MKEKENITFLILNMFTSTGGIQKVCRTLSYSLTGICSNSFLTLSLYDNEPDTRYISFKHYKGFSGRKLPFLITSLFTGLRSSRIIISHVNLIGIGLMIKFFNPKSKIILLAHGTEIWRKLPLWKSWFIIRYLELWSVSNYTDNVVNHFYHLRKPSTVINNCLDPFFRIPANFHKPEYLMARYSLSANQPILLTTCRLNEYEHDKGYNQVVRLIKKLVQDFPDIHYLLCGEADQKELIRLKNLITMNKLDNHISLCGFIDEQELTDHYLLADVFIMPSQKEGFGLVLIEAAVCGCRIIAGNKDGSRDALLNGHLGLLTDPTNPDQLYRAIVRNLRKKHSLKAKENLQAETLAHFGHNRYQTKIKNALIS